MMNGNSIDKPTLDCAIIDDEPVASARMKNILERFDHLKVLGIYNTYKEAHDHLLTSRPKVLFLDVELDKNHTAFELIEALQAKCYFPYVILVTAFEHYSIKAIKKNVFDYLVKPVDVAELKETIERLRNQLSTPYSNLIETNGSLSDREKEVLELVLKGNTSQEIAQELFVSKSTVDSHRKNILKKTGSRSVSDLMRMSRPTE